jgi:sulfide:quinone oxidoreductase
MADSKTILVLGGGVGGVATARALRKRLPRQHRVVLIDRERDHVVAPSLLWLMVGKRTAGAISRPLARLARKGIDVRLQAMNALPTTSSSRWAPIGPRN